MGDFAKKRNIRNAHRGYATKEFQMIETAIAEESENKITLLQDIKENLAETMKILGTLTEEILGLLEKDKDIEHEIADWNKFRRDIRKGIQKIEDYHKPTSRSASEQISNPPPTANQALGTQQTTCNQTVRARLPKLELKKFYGSVADWQSFWDAFRNAVHANSQLSEIDKLTYLRGLLGGEASTAIAGLSLAQGKYGAAIEILKKRLGDEQKIISAHMEMLLKLTPVHNGKETGKLRKLYGDSGRFIWNTASTGSLVEIT